MKEHDGDSSGYFALMERKIEKELITIARERVVTPGKVGRWTIPFVKFVHVGSRRVVRKLFERRDRYWLGVERRVRRKKKRRKSGGGGWTRSLSATPMTSRSCVFG